MGHTWATQGCVETKNNPIGCSLLLVGSRDQTPVSRTGGQCPCPLRISLALRSWGFLLFCFGNSFREIKTLKNCLDFRLLLDVTFTQVPFEIQDNFL